MHAYPAEAPSPKPGRPASGRTARRSPIIGRHLLVIAIYNKVDNALQSPVKIAFVGTRGRSLYAFRLKSIQIERPMDISTELIEYKQAKKRFYEATCMKFLITPQSELRRQ